MTAIPVYEPDIYADAAILDRYPHYAAMRALGPSSICRNTMFLPFRAMRS
jgi:hypothetical protein